MTDLRDTGAALHIPKGLAGRMYLRDAQGNLVVELNKPAGRMIELALVGLCRSRQRSIRSVEHHPRGERASAALHLGRDLGTGRLTL